MDRKNKHIAILYAVSAAALYAVNTPVSKLLLRHADTTMMAAFLYLGAGIGLMICAGVNELYVTARQNRTDRGTNSGESAAFDGSSMPAAAGKRFGAGTKQERLTKKELPYTAAMVVLDIAAPILLMLGIERTSSANVSLLNNFEIVATSVIAFVVFREAVTKTLWLAILMVTAASVILGFEGAGAFAFNEGSLFVLGACICWGFENNCTKMISHKSSTEIVVIKGLFSGGGSLLVALFVGERIPEGRWIAAILLLGFVAYGLSIKCYIMAQQHLGAAKTSAYYSIAPFLGVAFSMVLLGERPTAQFYAAMIIMAAGTAVMVRDTIGS